MQDATTAHRTAELHRRIAEARDAGRTDEARALIQELANDRSTDGSFILTATDHGFTAHALLPTEEDARELAARFPKSVGLRATFCRRYLPGTDGDQVGYVGIQANLGADGVNKGRNETGIRRYRAFLRHAERLGLVVVYDPWAYGNSLTEAELEEATS